MVKEPRVDDVIDELTAGGVTISREIRREDFEVGAELIEEQVGAHQSARAVEIKQRLTAAAYLHLDRKSAVGNVLYGLHFAVLRLSCPARDDFDFLPLLFLTLLPSASSRAKSTGAGIARSLSGSGCGDHLSSHSLHRSRTCGMTSRANISVLLRTSSGGIEPSCIRIIRWPQLRVFSASRRRSRTVFGEPAMT